MKIVHQSFVANFVNMILSGDDFQGTFNASTLVVKQSSVQQVTDIR